MRIMGMRIITYVLITLFVSGCSFYDSNLEKALKLAGDNRSELETVLNHYKHNPADSLKYKATCFLIENMPVHFYLFKEKYGTFSDYGFVKPERIKQ
jgi:hypothetical protein